jgi:WD40 repeat protein
MLMCGDQDGSISIWRFSLATALTGSRTGGGGGLNRGSGRGSRAASRAASPASRATSRAASPASRGAQARLKLDSSISLQATCASRSKVSCCAWHYDGTHLVTGHVNGDVLLWSVRSGKLEQGARIAVHDDTPLGCAVWPGEAHDLVLISSPSDLQVVQAAATVKQDECGIRYVVSSLPQLGRKVLEARRHATAEQQQQQQQQQQPVSSAQLWKDTAQPVAMAMHADGRRATLVTDKGTVRCVHLQARYRYRILWQRAVRYVLEQVLQRKWQARSQLLMLKRKVLAHSGSSRQRDSGGTTKYVASLQGGHLVVASNTSGACSTVQVSTAGSNVALRGAASPSGSSPAQAAPGGAAGTGAQCELIAGFKVVLAVPCAEAGWVSSGLDEHACVDAAVVAAAAALPAVWPGLCCPKPTKGARRANRAITPLAAAGL